MREITLTQGKVALVDDADFEALAQYKWSATKIRNTWYAIRNSAMVNGKRTTIYMHREIMGAGSGQDVDHVDGDGLHNWRENLRNSTKMQNRQNQHHKTLGRTSIYKGVTWAKKDRKWRGQIVVSHEHINLGSFDVESTAAQAYNDAALRYFGEFACLNDLEEVT